MHGVGKFKTDCIDRWNVLHDHFRFQPWARLGGHDTSWKRRSKRMEFVSIEGACWQAYKAPTRGSFTCRSPFRHSLPKNEHGSCIWFDRQLAFLCKYAGCFPSLSYSPPLSFDLSVYLTTQIRLSIMDFTYTYKPSEVSHTRAKAGDTDKWTIGLDSLLDSGRSLSMSHRELIKMDTTILDIEMKKASVLRAELEVSGCHYVARAGFPLCGMKPFTLPPMPRIRH